MAPNGPAAAADPPAGTARLFVALWPPLRLAAEWRTDYDRVRGDAPSRPEPAHRLHLTLHFIGAVPRDRIAELQTALGVPFDPFDLTLRCCERWPSGVVVMMPQQVPPALAALHAAIAGVLGRLQLPIDARVFRPHVTLARGHAGVLSVADPPAPEPPRWRVQEFVLAESPPDRHDPYRVLQAWRAQPAAAGGADGRPRRQ